jgi:general secretion pathway protein G
MGDGESVMGDGGRAGGVPVRAFPIAHCPLPIPHRSSSFARSSGFTFIELVITVAIVAILASVALPLAEVTVQRAKETELRRALREIRTAIDAYKDAVDRGRVPKQADESGYPPSLDALARGVPDVKDPKKANIYFLRRVPRDPMNDQPDLSAAETWGLRSYASPPDAPSEGEDVFDVYSRSERVGLNGVPYREW